jgi:TfoX/Sxy family transcriptional regulator of competence genes
MKTQGRRWKKSPLELVERFGRVLPSDDRVERRSMFGYPCAFANGNMFCGLHEDRLVARLPEAARAALLEDSDARIFEPMPGRRMREYVVVPRPLTNPDLPKILTAALRYAANLPPKAGRAKKRNHR